MKRTTDGRIVEKRVIIDKIILKEIILRAKQNLSISWSKFADKLGVRPITLCHDWLMDGRTIPLPVFKKLIKFSGLIGYAKNIQIVEPFWGQRLMGGKLKNKKVKLPNFCDKGFAEFYGILLGDGCIFSNLKGLSITGNKITDNPYYYKHLNKLIFSLFGIYPSFYELKENRTIHCVIHSKSIAEYMAKMGFPIGVKHESYPRIPRLFFKDKRLLGLCIRGLMDTDGSLSAHPHSKIMIHLSITIHSLKNSVWRGLNKLRIPSGKFNKGIMIYGKEKLNLFKKAIGFSNYKNIYKYKTFINTGRVPSSKETETFIRSKIKKSIVGPIS